MAVLFLFFSRSNYRESLLVALPLHLMAKYNRSGGLEVETLN